MDVTTPDATGMLFDRLPQAALLYGRGRGDRPRLERHNAAARPLVAIAEEPPLLTSVRTALSTGETLRQTRVRLPGHPHRRFQVRALPLGIDHVALLVEDITGQLARRADLSMWSDIVERLDDLFVICARDATVKSPGHLPVMRSTARLRIVAQGPPSDVDTRLEELAHFAMDAHDLDRLQPLLTAEGELSWRAEREGRVWHCHAWSTDDRIILRLTDVTERGQLARALSDHARLLRSIDESYEELVDVLGVHVRPPLRDMRRLRARLSFEQLPVEGRVEAERAFDRAIEAQRVVEGLLTYARISRIPVTGGAVDLDRALTRAIDALSDRVEASGASIRRQALPTIWGQEALIETLLRHLLANGLAHARPGRPPRIDVEVERRDAVWRLTVRDEGVGIDSARLPRIFEPFQRWGERPGGIGLAICRRIAEHHEGHIGIQSSRERGTTVWIELPAMPTPRY